MQVWCSHSITGAYGWSILAAALLSWLRNWCMNWTNLLMTGASCLLLVPWSWKETLDTQNMEWRQRKFSQKYSKSSNFPVAKNIYSWASNCRVQCQISIYSMKICVLWKQLNTYPLPLPVGRMPQVAAREVLRIADGRGRAVRAPEYPVHEYRVVSGFCA